MGVLGELGTGARSFKFDAVGATVIGTIRRSELVQRRKFGSGEPEYWADGKPVQQIRVILATELREDAEDDGERAVYIKAWGDQLAELQRVVKAAGDDDLHDGGRFGMRFTGHGDASGGGQPPKTYAFFYEKPAVLPQNGWGQQQPAPPPQQQFTPPQQQFTPPQQPQLPPQTFAQPPQPQQATPSWGQGQPFTATSAPAAANQWAQPAPPAAPPAEAGLSAVQAAAYKAAMEEAAQKRQASGFSQDPPF